MSETKEYPLNPRVMITGGNGFLGSTIAKELLDPESPVQAGLVRVLDLTKSYQVDDSRFESIQGDIRNLETVQSASKGMDIVIHSAAIVDWGTRLPDEVREVNYVGTENIIKACRDQKVKGLIYTSTLDVVYTGKPLVNIDESQPYPTRFHSMYCESKMRAEKAVLEANGQDLATCALRAADIYGEADPYHIGSLIDMAKQGFYVRLGNGKALTQHVYVGNIAFSHILATKAILSGNKQIGGKAYFITDPKPSNFFKFFDQVVTGAGYRIWPRNFWIPKPIAYLLGSIAEGVAFLLRPIKHYNPKFSRFAVTYTCTDYTFSYNRAAGDFNYKPKYSENDALQRTIDFYKKLKP